MPTSFFSYKQGIYWLYNRKYLDAERELVNQLENKFCLLEGRGFTLVIDLCGIRILLREDRELITRISTLCMRRGMTKQIYVVEAWKLNKMRIQARLHDMPYYDEFLPKNQEIEEQVSILHHVH